MATLDDTQALTEPELNSPEEGEDLHGRVLSLARRITSLAESDDDDEIEDPQLGHQLALSVKPYVDRLVALRHLLNPVGRIIEKRDQMEELRDEIAGDIASVEDASQELGESVDVTLMTELQTELAVVKRDRKLFTEDEEDEEDDSLSESEADDDGGHANKRPGRTAFLDRPVSERLRVCLLPG